VARLNFGRTTFQVPSYHIHEHFIREQLLSLMRIIDDIMHIPSDYYMTNHLFCAAAPSLFALYNADLRTVQNYSILTGVHPLDIEA
jgi:hypothetical protein